MPAGPTARCGPSHVFPETRTAASALNSWVHTYRSNDLADGPHHRQQQQTSHCWLLLDLVCNLTLTEDRGQWAEDRGQWASVYKSGSLPCSASHRAAHFASHSRHASHSGPTVPRRTPRTRRTQDRPVRVPAVERLAFRANRSPLLSGHPSHSQ